MVYRLKPPCTRRDCRTRTGRRATYVDGTRRLPISPLIDTYLVPEAPQGARSDPVPPLATSSAIGHGVGTAGTGGAGAEANINMAEATEPLALAAPTAAMSARLTAKKYLPTALISKQLPAGLSDMRTVPRLKAPDEWKDEAARLAEYVAAIRATASVFPTYNHKTETLAAYDSYMVWIDMWLRLSCFGSFVDVDL